METMDTDFSEIEQMNFDVQETYTLEWNEYVSCQNLLFEPPVITEESAILPYRSENTVTYWDQVCFMMHLFGDVQNPLHSSITLVNNLLESQMDILIEKCENAMKLRGAAEISHEDVLFLMRRNKVLLKCLLQFLDLQNFDQYSSYGRCWGSPVDECLEFLGTIEKFTGDLTCLFDKKAIDHATRKQFEKRKSIDDSRNKPFQDEFLPKLKEISPLLHLDDPDVFKEWLFKCRFKYPAGKYPFDISLLAASIIDFLAIKTVAGLVEKTLYMRSRACERKENMLSYKNFRLFEDTEDDESENNFTENEDLSSLSPFPKVVFCSENSELRYSSSDFIQRMGHPPVIIPMRKETQSEFVPKKPITPREIQTAFIHYQRPKPMSLLMKTKLPYLKKREVNLICLAFSDEEYEEL